MSATKTAHSGGASTAADGHGASRRRVGPTALMVAAAVSAIAVSAALMLPDRRQVPAVWIDAPPDGHVGRVTA